MEDFQFKFERQQINKIPRQKMIGELRRVAEVYNFTRFSRHDFDKVAKACKGSVILAEFGSWQKALDAIDIELKSKAVDKSRISTKELFEEMGRIWKSLGHRPSAIEWRLSQPKYSYTTYKQRFDGWTNACLKFIEFRMGGEVKEGRGVERKNVQSPALAIDTKNQEVKREIPLKLRPKVLVRDNFRCSYCGKSPATDRGTVLHIDHIIPYSKDGRTVLDNLRTLCAECNWGKGNDEKL